MPGFCRLPSQRLSPCVQAKRRLPTPRAREEAFTRRGETADLPQSELALKVLCEPRCVPSSVNAQPEECPVLLIIGRIGIRHYAYQSETIALSTGLDTAAQLRPLEPGVLKAA